MPFTNEIKLAYNQAKRFLITTNLKSAQLVST